MVERVKVHQLCARIEFGDAVSNHVLEIDRALRSWGFETDIFANTLDEFGLQVARPDSEYAGARGLRRGPAHLPLLGLLPELPAVPGDA